MNIKKIVLKDVKKNLFLPQKVFYKNIILNEIKWFTGSVLFRIITIVPVIFYIWYNLENKIILEI